MDIRIDSHDNWNGGIDYWTIVFILEYRGRIQLDIYGEGQNMLSLFDKARNHVQCSSNVYKHVWIVYDTDDFPQKHINRTAELCEQSSTEETEYHAIWSNQCIELWFLLHFSYFQSDIHRKEYWPKLSECMTMYGFGTYSKGREDMYSILEPYMDDAIRNARKLDAVNQGRTPAMSTPGTYVLEVAEVENLFLVEELLVEEPIKEMSTALGL